MGKKLLVALGGNALQGKDDKGTKDEQMVKIEKTCELFLHLLDEGYTLSVTHGNGPQVGVILLKNEMTEEKLPAMPLDICGAESQGMIGYMIQQQLRNKLSESGKKYSVVTLCTQTLVHKHDKAFVNPSKPIGPFYTQKRASELSKEKGWSMIEQIGKGYRRVVPSPKPIDIVEIDIIKSMMSDTQIVISCGGGGIPVIEDEKGLLEGVEAVIDKDLTGALLAQKIGADIFLILTDVDRVSLNFGTPKQKDLDKLSLSQAKNYLRDGEFGKGSMDPKVKAACNFVEMGGKLAVIGSLNKCREALRGESGTAITGDQVRFFSSFQLLVLKILLGGYLYMASKPHLQKQIGLWTLVSIGVGGIIGSGIFALPAIMAAIAGPGLILAIIIAGVITTFLALSYAELGAAFPLTGGPFSLPRLAMGDLGGFIMGWGYFIYLFVGTAAIIQIFIVYLGFYVPGLSIGTTLTPLGTVVGLAAVWLFTLINIYGVKWGGLYSVITTIGKLLPLILFAIIGFVIFDPQNFHPVLPFGMPGVTLAVTLFFWSYTGFEAIVVPSGEVKNPHFTIPWAMILTMFITIVCYLLVAVAFLAMIDWVGLGLKVDDWAGLGKLGFPLANVALGATSMKLAWLAIVITVGAIIATGGSGGTWILIQGRMPFAMAEEKLFWSPMKNVNKYGVPATSLIFTSILTSAILILIPHFTSVALIASITSIIPYAAAVLSVPILRITKKSTPRPFKLAFHKTFTWLAFVFSTWLVYWASWPWTMVGAILLVLGYPLFLLVRTTNLQMNRNHWIWVYLLGIVAMSILGDPHFVIDNFTPWKPMGWIPMPYDHIVLAVFATIIYFWAYKINLVKRGKR